MPAQAIAIVLVTPWNFAVNKLWSFRRALRLMTLGVLLAALALAAPAAAAVAERAGLRRGREPVQTPFVPPLGGDEPELTEEQAIAAAMREPEGRATGSSATAARS